MAMAEKPRPSPVVVASGMDEGNENSSSNLSSSKQTSRPWTKEEDDMIVEHVNKHGTKSWSLLASKIDRRTGKQMRERWHNQLDPNIRKDPWSKDEDERLVMAYQKYGSRWAEISKLFDCRTDNAIKNRWYGNLRKSTRSLEKTGQSPGGNDVKKDMSPSVGCKRGLSGSPVSSEEGSHKRQHLGSSAVQGQGFSTVAEAMVACFRVFEELQNVHLPKVMASIKFDQGEASAVDIPHELGIIKGRLEQNVYRTPHDFHKDIVRVWRQCADEKQDKALNTLASTLSKAFDELYFRSVYMPLNVVGSSVYSSKPASVGSRVRIYNSQEHRWWFGILTEHDQKNATSLVTEIVAEPADGAEPIEPLQVWTSIPSFYAEVVPNVATRSLSASCVRAALANGDGIEDGGDKGFCDDDIVASLERVELSRLFPGYKGGLTVLEALRCYVGEQQQQRNGNAASFVHNNEGSHDKVPIATVVAEQVSEGAK